MLYKEFIFISSFFLSLAFSFFLFRLFSGKEKEEIILSFLFPISCFFYVPHIFFLPKCVSFTHLFQYLLLFSSLYYLIISTDVNSEPFIVSEIIKVLSFKFMSQCFLTCTNYHCGILYEIGLGSCDQNISILTMGPEFKS